MKHDRITDDLEETASLCALGALSQNDARAFAAHLLDGCPVCEREMKEYSEIAGLLGSAATPVTPPAYLRDLLIARIEREPQQETPPSRATPFLQHVAVEETPVRASSAAVWVAWAVAAMLLAAFAYSFVMWRTDHRALQAEVERTSEARRAAAALNQRIEKEAERFYELAQINTVLSLPERRIIPLAGQDPAPNSSGKIYWDTNANRWIVTAELPPLPAGKVYQLWFVTPTSKISAGLIRPDDSGHGFTIVRYDTSIDHLAAAAITLEPEGGSSQPTLPIYVLGKPS